MAQTQFISARGDDLDARPLTARPLPARSFLAYTVFGVAFAFTTAIVFGLV